MIKQELIEIAQERNIFFRKSWTKVKIQQNIDDNISKDTKVTVVCGRSGIEFEVTVEKEKSYMVHPEIADWLNCKNYDIRYPAIEAIEEGRKQGLKTYEEFEALIEEKVYEANKPDPIPEHDFIGQWLARIDAAHSKYRFNRFFLSKVGEQGRHKLFNIAAQEDGIYEAGYVSAAGNKTKYYYQVENGTCEKISLEHVEKKFPKITQENLLSFDTYLGSKGSIVNREDRWYKVVSTETTTTYEDDDGVISDRYPADANYVIETDYHKTFVILATPEEIEAHTKRLAQRKAIDDKIKKAVRELKQINKDLLSNNNRVSPHNVGYPKGEEYVLSMGYFQANKILLVAEDKLWSLIYNGRDGDDWLHNNVGNAYIGCYILIKSEYREYIKLLIKDAQNTQQANS